LNKGDITLMSRDSWDFDDIDYETCPDCCGTGKDNYTLDWKCYTCNGLGRIKTKRNRDVKNSRNN
jgi:DnaJ-class molecular chaperone